MNLFKMKPDLGMGDQYIYNVKTPVNSDEVVSKGYVDKQ